MSSWYWFQSFKFYTVLVWISPNYFGLQNSFYLLRLFNCLLSYFPLLGLPRESLCNHLRQSVRPLAVTGGFIVKKIYLLF